MFESIYRKCEDIMKKLIKRTRLTFFHHTLLEMLTSFFLVFSLSITISFFGDLLTLQASGIAILKSATSLNILKKVICLCDFSESFRQYQCYSSLQLN